MVESNKRELNKNIIKNKKTKQSQNLIDAEQPNISYREKNHLKKQLKSQLQINWSRNKKYQHSKKNGERFI